MINPINRPPYELTSTLIESYSNEGYIALKDILTNREIEDAKESISELIQHIVHSPNTSKKGSSWKDEESKLYIQFEKGYEPQGGQAEDIELKVRKVTGYQNHPYLRYLSQEHPRLQKIIADLIQDEPLLYHDTALIKPPFIGSMKPWHQDLAFGLVSPLNLLIGVWIALDDVTTENGCMHVIPQGHKVGPLHHIDRGLVGKGDCEIAEGKIDPSQAIPVELSAGGIIFFNPLLPHWTPPNHSPFRRRALQLHYRGVSSKILSKEEYNKLYVDKDGMPASC